MLKVILKQLFFVFLVGILSSCGVKVEKSPMKVGETRVFFPTSKHTLEKPKNKKPMAQRNLHILFDLGGKNLVYDSSTVIEAYTSIDAKTPLFRWPARALRDMYRKTDCSSEAAKVLENGMQGDALFCDHQIDIDKIALWKAVRKNKRAKTSSKPIFQSYDSSNNVQKLVIAFH